MTSRWVVDVAPLRNVPVRWRAYSLDIKNEGVEIPALYREPSAVSRGALRVVEAVWDEYGDAPIGRLYTEMGIRFHLRGDVSRAAVAQALLASGLPRYLVEAADDERWDKAIRYSMDEAIDLVGEDVGVPVLLFRDGEDAAAVSGPVVSPAPRGDEALALWDHVSALAWMPGFFELKRTRTGPPQLVR
ncbi:MAG TPA: disulfide bond formation protein DsbA [Acidimicrobiales bacterium]|nr:disulfide bond formation protein DsbA [Acidimicrobiales bacterium]